MNKSAAPSVRNANDMKLSIERLVLRAKRIMDLHLAAIH
jgi:hypothetical protein